jgi:hypothetical protein
METHARRVVTWQSPGGGVLDVCLRCARAMDARGVWVRDNRGEEYCSVSRGEHYGDCEIRGLPPVQGAVGGPGRGALPAGWNKVTI